MLSFDDAKLLASTLMQNAVRPEGLATAGALVTCVAVVLNVGPFVAAQRGEPVRLVLAGEPMPQVDGVAWREQFAAEPDPAPEPPPAKGERPLFWLASADVTSFQPAAPRTAEPAAEPHADIAEAVPADHVQAEADKVPGIVGVWSPDGGNCTARDFKDGTLPTVINAEGAWAGETFCIFTKRREIGHGWRVVAKCSTPRARWTSNVRLTVADNRLTWTSERGTQAYTRCASDTLMAQAR